MRGLRHPRRAERVRAVTLARQTAGRIHSTRPRTLAMSSHMLDVSPELSHCRKASDLQLVALQLTVRF
jgi:hypothetical protein